jgi:hypothetical protein
VGENSRKIRDKTGKDLIGKILEMMEEIKNKKEILDSLGILNEKFNEKLELGTTKQSQNVTYLREETQQKIQVVNSKFNKLSCGVYASLELQMSGIKQNHTEMSKKFHDHKRWKVKLIICSQKLSNSDGN